ncbi:MAG TPA: hypothetical protein VK559_07430 [Ferruginibacter sp.]|nr:hypothetical protein [Ferruginibacter sp.]
MKSTIKLNWFLVFLFICANVTTAVAQSKDDILAGSANITFLGLDFSQTKFIGEATQFKDAGAITNNEFRDKYAPGWNELFVNEEKKYDVAKAIDYKKDIPYALDVTDKANSKIKKPNFFSNDLNDYKKLTADKIAGLVKKYNFQGKSGVGLIIFIEGMSKGKEEAGAWVAYVDMKSKKILLSGYVTGKSGGFGFKNYWAKAFLNILKDAEPKKLS